MALDEMFSKLNNLNNTWVIVSRHNGNVFFKRRNYVTKVKNYPDEQCLWYNEADAKNELMKLNSTRQKCKYSLENASKYFVNSFRFDRWSTRILINDALPIKSIQEKKLKVKDHNSIKNEFLLQIKNELKQNESYIYQA